MVVFLYSALTSEVCHSVSCPQVPPELSVLGEVGGVRSVDVVGGGDRVYKVVKFNH